MKAFWATRSKTVFFVFAHVSRQLFVPLFESKIGSLGSRFFYDFCVDFACFGQALGAVFLIVAALETGLKLECLSGALKIQNGAMEQKDTGLEATNSGFDPS